MQIAVLTFDGYNEFDSFIAAGAPVGEKQAYVAQALAAITSFLPAEAPAAA